LLLHTAGGSVRILDIAKSQIIFSENYDEPLTKVSMGVTRSNSLTLTIEGRNFSRFSIFTTTGQHEVLTFIKKTNAFTLTTLQRGHKIEVEKSFATLITRCSLLQAGKYVYVLLRNNISIVFDVEDNGRKILHKKFAKKALKIQVNPSNKKINVKFEDQSTQAYHAIPKAIVSEVIVLDDEDDELEIIPQPTRIIPSKKTTPAPFRGEVIDLTLSDDEEDPRSSKKRRRPEDDDDKSPRPKKRRRLR